MKERLLIAAIFCIAIFFRFNNLNWDNNFHLHPDERFLTMVGTAQKIPGNLFDYFNQKKSTLNPTNIGYQFFVYGTFPLTLNKILAYLVDMDSYNGLTILGRFLSALADLMVVYFVYKIAEMFQGKNKSLKYWAAFFYAISVLPIQLAHFYAVDCFLNMFMFGSFYFTFRAVIPRSKARYKTVPGKATRNLTKDFSPSARNDIIISAFLFGLALACKVTAIFILPLNLFFLIKTVFVQRQSLFRITLLILSYLLVGYFSVRVANPYYFENASFINPELNKVFINSIQSLKVLTIKNINSYYPPMVQWLSKNSMIHSLINNIVFGLGIPYAILVLAGVLRVALSFPRKRESIPIFVILFWTLGFFIYQSLQTTPTLRYFIIFYPFFAIFAAIGMIVLINVIARSDQRERRGYNPEVKSRDNLVTNKVNFILTGLLLRQLADRNERMIKIFFIFILLIWPLMFSSIYLTKNTRVAASEWIYKNIPSNSLILSEYWDDALPMPMIDSYGKQFRGEALTVFDPDTPEKWAKIDQQLKRADYYILSSNRAWGSIPLVPEKYPQGSEFYQDFFAGKLGYKKIKEFVSYPSLRWLRIPLDFPDQWSDEAFTVYDHPKVMIFINNKNKYD